MFKDLLLAHLLQRTAMSGGCKESSAECHSLLVQDQARGNVSPIGNPLVGENRGLQTRMGNGHETLRCSGRGKLEPFTVAALLKERNR